MVLIMEEDNMITLILTFTFIYFVMWLVFKLLGLVFKIALFPIKLLLSIIFAIVGYIVFPALVLFFMFPLLAVVCCWIFSKMFCPI